MLSVFQTSAPSATLPILSHTTWTNWGLWKAEGGGWGSLVAGIKQGTDCMEHRVGCTNNEFWDTKNHIKCLKIPFLNFWANCLYLGQCLYVFHQSLLCSIGHSLVTNRWLLLGGRKPPFRHLNSWSTSCKQPISEGPRSSAFPESAWP